MIIPSSSNALNCIDSGITCSGQGTESLTFSCTTVPTVDIVLQLIIVNTRAVDNSTQS